MPDYDKGYESGSRFRAMEELGWDPGTTYLALMVGHRDDPEWVRGFEHGVNGVARVEVTADRIRARSASDG